MILVIDNYDSFTFNLVAALESAVGPGTAEEVRVVRNDAVELETLVSWAPRAVLLSPGPGRPADAGISPAAVRAFGGRRPVLGVCLGLQCIYEVLGGRVVAARTLVHGRTTAVHHDGSDLFEGLPSPFEAARYHSLACDAATCPPELAISALAPDGEVMAVRHRRAPLWGVQFHPESFLSPQGPRLLANFLAAARAVFQL